MKGEITRQQKQFVTEFLALRKKNATLAAINAGYSEKSAASQASQLLKNPKVLDFLKIQEEKLSEELREEFFFDAIEARKVMYDVMKNPMAKDSDKISAAKDFLDRAGFKATEKVELSGRVEAAAKLEAILRQLEE